MKRSKYYPIQKLCLTKDIRFLSDTEAMYRIVLELRSKTPFKYGIGVRMNERIELLQEKLELKLEKGEQYL